MNNPAGGADEEKPHSSVAKKLTCGHPKCDYHDVTANHSRCSGFCEAPDSDTIPKRIEDILSAEQQRQLHADLKEIADKRRRAYDSARNWPLP